jgi:hypothetical protein
MEPLDLAARLTLALLIVYAGDYWYLRIPMRMACVLAIITPSFWRSSAFWLVLTAVMAWGNAFNWFSIDNHKYLMTYWCLAISLSLSVPNGSRVLSINARWLIGLCFGFAVFWKGVFSTDYLNGSFFEHTLLSDARFSRFAQYVGGMTREQHLGNMVALRDLLDFKTDQLLIQFQHPASLTKLALLMTWGTLGMEVVIALCFLLPWSGLIGRLRHVFLLLFAVGTYAVATVAGFAWLLMIMGCAQCEPDMRRTRLAYVTVFFLIQVYTMPWGSFLPS